MTTMGLDLPGSGKGFSEEMVIEEPTGKSQTVEGDVKVPLFKAAIYSLVASLVTLTLALIWGWPSWNWPEWVPILAGVGGFAFFWIILESDTRNLLRRQWTATPQEKVVETLRVEVHEPEKGQTKYAHFNARPEQVRKFATDALNGKLTVHASRLSRRLFERLRDESVARGLLAWRNPEAHHLGIEMTSVGRHVFRRLIE